MAEFLTTTATSHYLERLIINTRERLVLISPYLKFNARIKELLEDLNRMKVDIRIVYGKSELAPAEINWLSTLEYVRTSFCQNLHAKCYINEHAAIITSMNLYAFSQVNNNEMGVYIEREVEPDLYHAALEEAQRLVRISDLVKLSADKIEDTSPEETPKPAGFEKLTTSRLARAMGKTTLDFTEELVSKGFLERDGEQLRLTSEGTAAGGEFGYSKRHGPYFIWPKDMRI